MSITATAPANPFAVLSPAAPDAGSATASADSATSDRFLKLLVTQMKNQDPLNPMDNAQVTSQMAQISTVSGIQQLNTTVSGLNSQFLQLQSLQAASLVGHDVTLKGDSLSFVGGQGAGGFELATPADSVKVDILGANGAVVQSLNLGAQPAGMNGFVVPGADPNANLHFRVSATAAGTAIGATPLMRDHVNAVAVVNNQLTLQTTRSGDVDYSSVKAVN